MNSIEEIKAKLERKYSSSGKERVGFVTQAGDIVEVRNICDQPEYGFMVSPEDIVKHVEDLGCWATWHTHPDQDSNLSGEDYKTFKDWGEMHHFIVGKDGVRCYRFDPERKALVTA